MSLPPFFFSAIFPRFPTKLFFFLFCLSSFFNQALAQTRSESAVRLRLSLPQVESQDLDSLLIQGQFHFKGAYYFNNNWRWQTQIILSNPYQKKFSVKKTLKVYPSLQWFINESLDLKIGRIFYENKFPQIISLNRYESFLSSFDGFFLDYNTKILNINLWGAALPKRWIGKSQIQELKYGFGFFLDLKSISNYIDDFNVHTAYLLDSFFYEEAQKTSRYGLGLKGSIKPINLSYTFVAVGHGEGIKFTLKQKMYHILFNYSYPELLDSAFSAGYHKDSSKYKPWLYDRHKMAGFLDLFLWGNLNYFFLKFKAYPRDRLKVQLSFYNLSSTEEGFIQKGYFSSFFQASERDFFCQSLSRAWSRAGFSNSKIL